MKLKLKHLARYLPYGLKIQILNHKCDYVGIEFSEINGYYFLGDSLHISYNGGSTGKSIEDFKPILLPLSDLTKEINYGLSTYAFTDLFEIGDCDGCVFEFEHGNIKTIKALENISKYNSYNDINYLPNAVVNMMYEYHFDVFGLIERGLAIDKNTLNK